MSKGRHHFDADHHPTGSGKRTSRRIWPIAALGLALALCALIMSLPTPRPAAVRPTPAETGSPPPKPTAATNAPARTTPAGSDYAKLAGKWVRPDGGYVLEIRNLDGQGRIEASYFNPQPIHVARAEASIADGQLRANVELRDSGYPGCTYKLTFDPQSDELRGEYFQAALQETFDVVFVRMK